MTGPAFRNRALVAWCALGTAIFLVCYAIAIALYPGGTWFNRHARGHSLAKNFLCDLMQTRALNGQDARVGSILARVGIVAMFGAVAAFFAMVSAFDSTNSRPARIVRWAGLIACTFGCAVPLFPSDRFRDAHVAAVILAFVPSVFATVGALSVCLRTPRVSMWLRAFAVFTLATGALDGVGYGLAYAFEFGYLSAPRSQLRLLGAALPAFQRAATFGLLAWIGAVCLHTWRAGARRTRN